MSISQIDVAIIGAGTAGLSARSEVAKITDSYRVFDPGPLGTTCARNGCMPSKAFLQSAHDYHRRHAFDALGIQGGAGLQVNGATVLHRTRELRDDLVEGVVDGMDEWKAAHFVCQSAEFTRDGTLRAGDEVFRPRATVIATGTRPIVPSDWKDALGDRMMTTDTFFEMPDLPGRVAVIGLGPVGLELGQALARLGVEVTGFDPAPMLGGISDPELQGCLDSSVSREMQIVRADADPRLAADGSVILAWEDGETRVDCVLVAMGRAPNVEGLGLDRIGVQLTDDSYPDLPAGQLNASGSRVYFAGDVSGSPALLHEAADEGRVAGFNAVRGLDAVFSRRVPLAIVFTDPQIATVGATIEELENDGTDVAVGSASFASAGRVRLARSSGGIIRIYADRETAQLRGAAIIAPEAEHLAHLLAYAISREADLRKMLRMPFYHPTHEEVLRRAIRASLAKCRVDRDPADDIRCHDAPVDATEAETAEKLLEG
ncbi:MAG: dihydrolipoyl dehydrogenase [Silicimonas sp.]|nr:dihydrolipoyl dehydrogenase [Silicimonas sp.]